MSTREREVTDPGVTDAGAAHPSGSMALVPLPREEAPLPPPASLLPANAHRLFYGMGYAGLAFILLATWLTAASDVWPQFLFAMGGMGLVAGGLGVFVHVVYRPRMDKLRKGLGAVAAVVLTAAATVPVEWAAREVHAQPRIAALQGLADALVSDPRIRDLGVSAGAWVEYDGRAGPLEGLGDTTGGGPPVVIAEELWRDGISTAEVQGWMERMRQEGVMRLQVRSGYVAFAAHNLGMLLYVAPGQPFPAPGTTILDAPDWRSRPMGGGWYLLR